MTSQLHTKKRTTKRLFRPFAVRHITHIEEENV